MQVERPGAATVTVCCGEEAVSGGEGSRTAEPLECDPNSGCPECPRKDAKGPETPHFVLTLVDIGGRSRTREQPQAVPAVARQNVPRAIKAPRRGRGMPRARS